MDDSTRATYEARAGEWAQRRPPRLVRQAEAFSHRCLPGRPLVDLGCGPGSYFSALGRRLIGLDGTSAMLDLARHSAPDVALVRADLAQLPFAPRRLGGAWARASYLHLPRSELPAALAQLQGALAVGAPLEMTMRAGALEGCVADDEFPGRFFAEWHADDLANVVCCAGFDIEQVEHQETWLTVRATRAATLPDFVGPAMSVLVCGLNPSVVAADAGFGYAGTTNRFWPAATAAGLISPAAARRPLVALTADHVGMTDLVKRATRRASQLTVADYAAGAVRVVRMVEWLSPGLVLFVGLAGWRAAVDRRARAGLQPRTFGRAPAYVMPSTSGLNASTTMTQLVEHMRAAKLAVAGPVPSGDSDYRPGAASTGTDGR